MQREQPSPRPEPTAICRSCTQAVTTHGAHGCPGFLRPATATFPPPTSVLCSCGVSYRYGDSHSCVVNGTFFSTPAIDPNSDRIASSLERIASALESIARRLAQKLAQE